MNMALDSDSQEAALSDIRALNAARIGTRPENAGEHVIRPFMLLSVLQSLRPAIYGRKIRLAR